MLELKILVMVEQWLTYLEVAASVGSTYFLDKSPACVLRFKTEDQKYGNRKPHLTSWASLTGI